LTLALNLNNNISRAQLEHKDKDDKDILLEPSKKHLAIPPTPIVK